VKIHYNPPGRRRFVKGRDRLAGSGHAWCGVGAALVGMSESYRNETRNKERVTCMHCLQHLKDLLSASSGPCVIPA